MAKIAIIIPGGIGMGNHNDGVPILGNLLNGLAQGHDVTVFSLVSTSPEYEPLGFKIIHSGLRNNAHSVLKFICLFFAIFFFVLTNRVKAFHGFWTFPSGFLAVVFAKLNRSQSVVSLQGGDLVNFSDIKYGGSQNYFRKSLVKWTLKQSDVITVESNYIMSQLKSFLPGAVAKLIYYGVDTERFRFQKKEITPPVRFIHIGNHNLIKDQKILLQAFGIIRKSINCTLTIIGEDFLNGTLPTLAKRLNLDKDTNFLGYQPQMSIPSYLNDADIMLHSSRHESTAMVVIEAMAAGVLVCGTSVGILADLAASHCVSVPIGDYEKLAQETLLLINNPQRMAEMRIKARKWTETKDLPNTISEISQLYQ